MEKKELDTLCEALDTELKRHGLSRRDALKLAGLSSAAFLLNPSASVGATSAVASSVTGKILIVGGGAAGCSIANALVKKISSPDITLIEPNPQSVTYQPGQTFVA
ncbi:MAG: NAD(P)/FAD-dependent oxidoreductase, partial [Campylobacterales bacterium]|nr:NAD(P)/FAD-dependent oxidoreductase [Campylobacterales bacterium]